MQPAAIGIDIGGTHIRAGVIARDGSILSRTRAQTPAGAPPDQLVATIADALREIEPPAGGLPVGVALPGIRDAAGAMIRAHNLPGLVGVRIPDLLYRAVGRPVTLESDVNAAAWAQWLATRPCPTRFAYLSIGTGVGGAVVLDGRLLRHVNGGAGHFGLLIVDASADAPSGRSGIRGSLEGVLCEPDLADSSAGEIRRANALAVALFQLTVLIAPDVIALGGGRIESDAAVFDAAALSYEEKSRGAPAMRARITRAPLPSDDAGLVGAALLALDPH